MTIIGIILLILSVVLLICGLREDSTAFLFGVGIVPLVFIGLAYLVPAVEKEVKVFGNVDDYVEYLDASGYSYGYRKKLREEIGDITGTIIIYD